MDCYYYALKNHKPALMHGVPKEYLEELIRPHRYVAATPKVKTVLADKTSRNIFNIGIEKSIDYGGCFKFVGANEGNVADGFLVFTAKTIKDTDINFNNVKGVEVLWQEVTDRNAKTVMVVRLSKEEFESRFKGKIIFFRSDDE